MVERVDYRFRDNISSSLYDTEGGFYFRQRKGTLNLRRLESIDVPRLIREVDIEVLQQNLEDLTFCDFNEDFLHFLTDRQVVKLFKLAQLLLEYLLYSQSRLVQSLSDMSKKYAEKKRALQQKRKELVALREEADGLKAELKIRRKNLRSLEKSVRSAVRARDTAQGEEEKERSEPAMLRLFVALPDGTCVEVMQSPQCSLQALETIVKNALAPHAKWAELVRSSLRFFHQGKLLLGSSTLAESGVRHNDSLMLIAPEKPQRERAPVLTETAPPVEAKTRREEETRAPAEDKQSQHLEELTREIKTWIEMTKELHAKSKESVAPTSEESKTLNKIATRLGDMEVELKELSQRPQVVQMPSTQRLQFGQIENDRDDLSETIHDIHRKISDSLSRVDTLDNKVGALNALRDAIRDQHIQLDELRNLVSNTKPVIVKEKEIIVQTLPAPAAVPAPVPVPEPKPAVKQAVKIRQPLERAQPVKAEPIANKWNLLAQSEPVAKKEEVLVLSVSPRAKQTPPPVEEMKNEEPEPSPRVPSPLPLPREEKKEEIVKEEVKAPSPAKEAEPEPVLPPQMPGKVRIEFPRTHNICLDTWDLQSFWLDLDPDQRDDDLIIAIRKELSHQTRVTYSRTALVLFGKHHVKIAVDLAKLVPSFTSADAAELAADGRLQLFIETPTVTKTQIDILQPLRRADTHNMSRVADRKEREKDKDRYHDVRVSLSSLMASLDEKGLSDDDLRRKRREMNDMVEQHESKAELRHSRLSLAKSIGYATSESESDYFSERERVSATRTAASKWEDLDQTAFRRRSYESLWQDTTLLSTQQNASTASQSQLGSLNFSDSMTVPPLDGASFSSTLIRNRADSYERDAVANQSMESPFNGSGHSGFSADGSLALSDSNNFAD